MTGVQTCALPISTKFASGNIFKTHLMDAMFNLIGQITGQGVQLLGMLTEAIHTPHLADRAMAIENARYIFNNAFDLGNELELKSDGFINQRANQVLAEAVAFLENVSEIGLFNALERGEFAEIKRSEFGGKGFDGVFRKESDYINPFIEMMKAKLQSIDV